MKISLCNEVLGNMPFSEQCEFSAGLGYRGLEIAPSTLGEDPIKLSRKERRNIRSAADQAGIVISGLHWLLVGPEGLSITSLDRKVRQTTSDYITGLIELCGDLGGTYLVHGSPAQRRLPDDPTEAEQARNSAMELFHEIATTAESAAVTYCIEPLAQPASNFINSVEEAARIVDQVGSPNMKTMLDCRAALLSEKETPQQLISTWLPRGYLAHIHFNDTNRRGPGQGATKFLPILSTLLKYDYSGWIGLEPFVYEPDGPSTAAFISGYLKGLLEALARN